MVRLKQPARQSTSYARFLGLLPRPEVTKSYRQPDSSNNDSTGPSNVYTSDTVCAERRDGFDITRSQAVHSPFLPTTGAEVGTHGYSTVPVHSGWATTYLASRQKHLQLPGVFVAHLVGDASKADLYVSLASSNLALCRCKTAADSYAAGSHAVIMSLLTQVQFCSEWGRNRVDQHKDTTQPLQLIMPVYTTREVVLQAIIGILGGQIKLSLLDVEPILVLANSIRVECLEEACVQYLCNQAGHMSSKMLVCLARLGDHLGLSALGSAAAEHIVQLPWQVNMLALAAVLQTSFYKHRQDKLSELLHHAHRGAYSELQVLQLLESMSCEEADIAAIVQIDMLQPAELQILLAILVNPEHSTPGELLHKAVQQHVKCGDMHAQTLTEEEEIAMDVKQTNSPTRCIPNIIFISEHDGFRFDEVSQGSRNVPRDIPDSQLQVWLKSNNINGNIKNGIYFHSSDMSQPFAQTVQSFAVFSMHTSAPYIRSIRASDHSEFRDADSLTWVGYNDYLDELSNAHPAGYKGLFTIGFWWQEHTAAASSSSEPVLIVPKGDD